MEQNLYKVAGWTAVGSVVGLGTSLYRMAPGGSVARTMAVTGLKSGVAAASFYLIRHITMREEADHALGSFFAGAGTGWWMSIGATASKSAVARNMIAGGLLGLGIWAVEKEAYVQLQKALFHDESATSVPTQLSSSSANAETEKEARKPLFEIPAWFPIRPAKEKSSNNS